MDWASAADVFHQERGAPVRKRFLKLDTPCTAGARSTISIRACRVQTRSDVIRWASSRWRAIEENSQKIVYRGGSGGSMLLLSSCKKIRNQGPKRGPWTGWYQLLTSLRAIHIWIKKIQRLKLPVDSSTRATPHIPVAKINYFPNGRTDERTNGRTDIRFSCTTDGKSASRN